MSASSSAPAALVATLAAVLLVSLGVAFVLSGRARNAPRGSGAASDKSGSASGSSKATTSSAMAKQTSASSSAAEEPKQRSSPAQVHAPAHIPMLPSSCAEFQRAATTHISFDIQVDFNERTCRGLVTFSVVKKDPAVDEFLLDTRDLVIHGCQVKIPGAVEFSNADFSQGKAHPVFGSALRVHLPHSETTSTVLVRVRYETTTNSSALQFLSPSQTAGKSHPYLFTQSQAIHARSFFPCQDTPGVKATFDAKVLVPTPLVALMSAVSTGSSKTETHATYTFRQQIPVPSYLVALAVGDLESRELGPRTRVWSEPSMVELAQREFIDDTERFLTTAEQLCGDYVWGRYDLLVLPPSFPYGGMENPCLVFLTPTLLAGDRSLVNVVAHEIGHCWFGNLVTNATWEDFWMNEGFTVFCERRIIAKLFGEARAGLKATLGRRHLKEDVDRFGADHEFTKLHINMRDSDIDPDDSFSSVPYEKGCAFLEYLEKLVGGPSVFEPFLKEYVVKFRFGFVEMGMFRQTFSQAFPAQAAVVDWDTWLEKPGMPITLQNDKLVVDGEQPNILVELAESAAEKWLAGGTATVPDEARGANTSWSSDQLVVFLEKLVELQQRHGVTHAFLESVDAFFRFSLSRNSEVRFKWNTLGLRVENPTEACLEDVVDFVTEQGRMKFVRPLYRDLNKANRDLALRTFASHKDNYHAIAQKMIAKDLSV